MRTGRVSVDHIVPVSQGGAFWATSNLRASCKRCNYGQGAKIAADNRRARTAELHRIIASQQDRISELTAALAAATTNPTAKPGR